MSSTAGDLNEDEPSRDSTETYDAVGSEENDKDSSKNGITDSSVPPEMSRNEEKTEVDVSAISGSEDGKIIGTSAGSSNNSEGDTSSTVLKITPEDIPASVENSSAVDNGEVLPKHNNEQQSTSDFESEKAKKSESDDKLAKQKSEGRRKTTESKRRDPQPFVYDPRKITLRFLFANRDGIHVTIDFKPDNTIGEVKAALLSSWPKAIPECSAGGSLRLICMGKGILAPDSRTQNNVTFLLLKPMQPL
eukprot:CAMPEP_0184866430 /NCGR_PEP_ID=MMETSP0580-20130426/22324_1 /TAXON_ID=1118495 /ORGANISM="Dactyliosolen fragilissimus" /LENGTH=247 /DNA_ID=CAMNT_0027366125 /DNA_START=49 /DNA_END=793 /DNA_ORIENTATION=-